MEIQVKMSVPDDFEYGDCERCPLSYTEYEEEDAGEWVFNVCCCLSGDTDSPCPLEVQNALRGA